MDQQIKTILAEKGSHVESIGPEATVAEAVRRMNEKRIGSLLVLDGERPVGIFTERDVLARVVAARSDADQTLIRDVMTAPMVCISPSTTVEEAMAVITDKRCRHLPVMDGGALVGMVSIGDLTRSLIRLQKAEIEDLFSYIRS